MNNDNLGGIVIFLRTILCSHMRESRETHFFEPYLFSPTKQQPTNENSSKDTEATTIITILSHGQLHYGHEYYTSVFLSVYRLSRAFVKLLSTVIYE